MDNKIIENKIVDQQSQEILVKTVISISISTIINIGLLCYREFKTRAFRNNPSKILAGIIYTLYFFVLEGFSWGQLVFSQILSPFYLLLKKVIGINLGLGINLVSSNIIAILSIHLGFTSANIIKEMLKKKSKVKYKDHKYTFVRDWCGLINTSSIQGILLFVRFFAEIIFLVLVFLFLDQIM